MRTRLAAFSFTAAILASVLVPAFGGTAFADGGDGCVGQHVLDEIDHPGSLLEAADEHGFDIGGYVDFLRAHCGR